MSDRQKTILYDLVILFLTTALVVKVFDHKIAAICLGFAMFLKSWDRNK